MRTTTKRTIIAAAAMTAAGLFGSLPFHGFTQAQGVPIQHHDVALVDATSDLILSTELGLDDQLYAGVFGTSGLEAELYNGAVTSLGADTANTLLGTTDIAGADGLFDGAATSFSSGVLLDSWAFEDEVNQLLGVTASVSQDAILGNIAGDPSLVLATGDLLPAAGSGFDAALMTLATDDFTAATTEFTAYLDGLPNLLGDLGGLLGGLGDGTGGLGDVLSGLLGELTGGLDLGSILGSLGL